MIKTRVADGLIVGSAIVCRVVEPAARPREEVVSEIGDYVGELLSAIESQETPADCGPRGQLTIAIATIGMMVVDFPAARSKGNQRGHRSGTAGQASSNTRAPRGIVMFVEGNPGETC